MISICLKKLTNIAMVLIFFSSENWKSILFEKKAPFPPWYNADAQFRENAPLLFVKNAFLQKIEKRRVKGAFFILSLWWYQESKRRIFFWLGTNMVCRKSAFSWRKHVFCKIYRGFREWNLLQTSFICKVTNLKGL